MLQVQLEDLPHPRRLIFIDDELEPLGVDVVAEDRMAACPLPLATSRRDLVAGPLGDDLPLELRERHQHVHHEPAG